MELTNWDNNKRRKKPNIDLSTMVYGKIPPQAKEVEEAVLGALMLDKKAYSIIFEKLRPEHFYVDAHQRIFSAIIRLDVKRIDIDILTVVEELKINEELDMVGGPYALTKLTKNVVSSAHIEDHSKIIYQKWLQRLCIQFAGEIISDAYEDSVDPFELVDKMVKMNDAITQRYIKSEVSYESLVLRTVKNILDYDPDNVRGISTGFRSLDEIIDYWINGLFYIIAARPAMGKTAFMIQLVENLTRDRYSSDGSGKIIKNRPVGVIELETHDEGFIQRQIGNKAKINTRAFKNGELTEEEKELMIQYADDLLDKGIVADFDPVSTITDIRLKAKRWKVKYDIGILLVDYLQYIDVDQNDRRIPREQQVGNISRGLAGLAKELDIPVIAFAQLSREVYKRADKRPQISDLRESGRIEQDARCIMFLHRPEYYGELHDPETNESLVGITEVIVAKNNEGNTGEFKLKMIKEYSRFEEIETEGMFKAITTGGPIVKDAKGNPFKKGMKMTGDSFDDVIEETPTEW